MAVSVVQVRVVRVRMGERRVPVPMGVRFADWVAGLVRMLMVDVVYVGVGMFQ